MQFETAPYICQRQLAESSAGGELRQELQRVAKQLQTAEQRDSPQVQDRCCEPVVLQRDVPQLTTRPQFNCKEKGSDSTFMSIVGA